MGDNIFSVIKDYSDKFQKNYQNIQKFIKYLKEEIEKSDTYKKNIHEFNVLFSNIEKIFKTKQQTLQVLQKKIDCIKNELQEKSVSINPLIKELNDIRDIEKEKLITPIAKTTQPETTIDFQKTIKCLIKSSNKKKITIDFDLLQLLKQKNSELKEIARCIKIEKSHLEKSATIKGFLFFSNLSDRPIEHIIPLLIPKIDKLSTLISSVEEDIGIAALSLSRSNGIDDIQPSNSDLSSSSSSSSNDDGNTSDSDFGVLVDYSPRSQILFPEISSETIYLPSGQQGTELKVQANIKNVKELKTIIKGLNKNNQQIDKFSLKDNNGFPVMIFNLEGNFVYDTRLPSLWLQTLSNSKFFNHLYGRSSPLTKLILNIEENMVTDEIFSRLSEIIDQTRVSTRIKKNLSTDFVLNINNADVIESLPKILKLLSESSLSRPNTFRIICSDYIREKIDLHKLITDSFQSDNPKIRSISFSSPKEDFELKVICTKREKNNYEKELIIKGDFEKIQNFIDHKKIKDDIDVVRIFEKDNNEPYLEFFLKTKKLHIKKWNPDKVYRFFDTLLPINTDRIQLFLYDKTITSKVLKDFVHDICQKFHKTYFDINYEPNDPKSYELLPIPKNIGSIKLTSQNKNITITYPQSHDCTLENIEKHNNERSIIIESQSVNNLEIPNWMNLESLQESNVSILKIRTREKSVSVNLNIHSGKCDINHFSFEKTDDIKSLLENIALILKNRPLTVNLISTNVSNLDTLRTVIKSISECLPQHCHSVNIRVDNKFLKNLRITPGLTPHNIKNITLYSPVSKITLSCHREEKDSHEKRKIIVDLNTDDTQSWLGSQDMNTIKKMYQTIDFIKNKNLYFVLDTHTDTYFLKKISSENIELLSRVLLPGKSLTIDLNIDENHDDLKSPIARLLKSKYHININFLTQNQKSSSLKLYFLKRSFSSCGIKIVGDFEQKHFIEKIKYFLKSYHSLLQAAGHTWKKLSLWKNEDSEKIFFLERRNDTRISPYRLICQYREPLNNGVLQILAMKQVTDNFQTSSLSTLEIENLSFEKGKKSYWESLISSRLQLNGFELRLINPNIGNTDTIGFSEFQKFINQISKSRILAHVFIQSDISQIRRIMKDLYNLRIWHTQKLSLLCNDSSEDGTGGTLNKLYLPFCNELALCGNYEWMRETLFIPNPQKNDRSVRVSSITSQYPINNIRRVYTQGLSLEKISHFSQVPYYFPPTSRLPKQDFGIAAVVHSSISMFNNTCRAPLGLNKRETPDTIEGYIDCLTKKTGNPLSRDEINFIRYIKEFLVSAFKRFNPDTSRIADSIRNMLKSDVFWNSKYRLYIGLLIGPRTQNRNAGQQQRALYQKLLTILKRKPDIAVRLLCELCTDYGLVNLSRLAESREGVNRIVKGVIQCGVGFGITYVASTGKVPPLLLTSCQKVFDKSTKVITSGLQKIKKVVPAIEGITIPPIASSASQKLIVAAQIAPKATGMVFGPILCGSGLGSMAGGCAEQKAVVETLMTIDASMQRNQV